MAKVVARMSMRGSDIRELMAQAKEQMTEAGLARVKVTEMEMYGQDDMATKQGMVRMWNCSMTIEGEAPD